MFRKNLEFKLLVFLSLLSLGLQISAAEKIEPAQVIYVNNVTGNDDFDGLKAEPGDNKSGPLQTIMQAVKKCAVGARIEIANTGVDYRESVSIEKYNKGQVDRPLVLNGNGACVNGLVKVQPEQWVQYKDDIYYFLNKLGGSEYKPRGWFDRKIGDSFYGIMPNSNWLGNMKHQGWFIEEDAPEIFLLNGKPGKNVLKLEEIPPGGFFYDSQVQILKEPAGQRVLFFRLPANTKIEDCSVELPLNKGIYASDDYITIMNIGSVYSQDDGFAGFWGQGVVLKNIYAAYNCDQGVSFHGNSTTLIDGALIERNGGCGIVDVMSCTTIYRNVTVRNNYPGGALLQGFAHAIYNGVISDNSGGQVSGGHGASISLINCLIIGRGDKSGSAAVGLDYGRLDQCTILNSRTGVCIFLGADISNSVIADCQNSLFVGKKAVNNVQLKRCVLGDENIMIDNKQLKINELLKDEKTYSWLSGAVIDALKLTAPGYLLPQDYPLDKLGKGRLPGNNGKNGYSGDLIKLSEKYNLK